MAQSIEGQPVAISRGYQVGQLSKVELRYKCTKCSLILRNPMQATGCGHRFCQLCVPFAGFECPGCIRDKEDVVPLVTPDSLQPDKAAKRELQRAKFYCPWGGCKAQPMLLSDLVSHAESECKHRHVACSACGQELPVGNMEKHSTKDCPKRLVQCEACAEYIAMDELASHKKTQCLGSTRQCESCLARVPDSPEARKSHALEDCPVGWADGRLCPYGCSSDQGGLQDAKKHRHEELVRHIDLSAAQLARFGSISGGNSLDSSGDSGSGQTKASAKDGSLEAQVDRLDNRLSMVDTKLAVVEFGLPHCPADTPDAPQQAQFFDRLERSFRAVRELQKEHRSIDEKMRDSELKMRPLMEQKQAEYEELSRASDKYSELLRAMGLKEVSICDVERSIALQEMGSHDGTLFWKIAFFRERLNGTDFEPVVVSPILFTDKFGYKLIAMAYLNGFESGLNTHLSLFVHLLKGPYDGSLQWPFKYKVTLSLMDQTSSSGHLSRDIHPDQSSQFQRPSQPMGQRVGFEKFAPKDDLEGKGYLKDDTLFVKIQVAKPTLTGSNF